MNSTLLIKKFLSLLQKIFDLHHEELSAIQITLNVEKEEFGDFCCNAALVLAKKINKAPREIAEQIKHLFLASEELSPLVQTITIAGPGFVNISLKKETWQSIATALFQNKQNYFVLDQSEPKRKYLVEFVSANPTGPLHLGHGRGGIIGDVLSNVLNFLGHTASREFFINDAGNQIEKLGRSLKVRCQQELGQDAEFPDDGYAGDYLIDLAKQCIEHYGPHVIENDNPFFQNYAKDQLLEQIKQTLDNYGISFDRWFSEQRLHKDGSVEKAIALLKKRNLAYTKDDALWFKSTEFHDDKDRVLQKNDGSYTYIAADIAYHKNKFERGYQTLINVLGQDHHGYIKRLKGTMEALGYNAKNLDVILYQLVSIKQGGEQVKMSKRAGTFEKLSDLIEKVGKDIARFFYLNRKADAHLDFDIDVALKKTEENPVYYIQYAYVRTKSLLEKAKEHTELKNFIENITSRQELTTAVKNIDVAEISLIKKMCYLAELLRAIAHNYQMHLLAYYTLELTKNFHTYYAKNKIIDVQNIETTKSRLFTILLFQQTCGLCLDLLGLSKPERM